MDVAEIEALHRRHAPTPADFELVWTHCRIVRDLALGLAPAGVDRDLIEAGALLHDIGVYRLDGAPYICHGVRGEELLTEAGLPPSVSRFASHHTGAGLTKEQIIAGGLPLPPRDYLAGTIEEELVMYADKFHTKSRPPSFVSWATAAAQLERFGAAGRERFEGFGRRFGRPDLTGPAARYGHPIR
jgi:uncharacterized protein